MDHVENGFFVGGSWHHKGTELETPPTSIAACAQYGLGFTVRQAPVMFRPLVDKHEDSPLLPDECSYPIAEPRAVCANTAAVATTELALAPRYYDSNDDVIDADFIDNGGELVSHDEFESAAQFADLCTVPKFFVNYRTDTGAALGVVRSRYVPAQYDDVFGPLQPLLDAGILAPVSGGSLKGGKYVWMCLQIKDGSVDVLPNDELRSNLLVCHAHDGSMTIHIGCTTIRVVCWNTLTASLMQDGAKMYKIRHTGSASVNIQAAIQAIDFERKKLMAQADVFRSMTRVNLSEKQMREYVRKVLSATETPDPDRKVSNEDSVMALLDTGNGTQYGRGTLYHAFNAVTEFLSHYSARTVDNRMSALWFPQPGKNKLGKALIIASDMLTEACV